MSRKFFALEESGLSLGTEGELEAEDVMEASEAAEEVAVDAEEVDALATAIEDAEVAASNMEEVAEVLEEGVESGEGVSEETAAAAEIAVEACLNMLGTSHRRRSLMPSLESWGSGRSRLVSTKIALESITDSIKKIWERIKAFVKRTWEKVKDFIAGLFTNAEKVKKAIEKARETINGITNDEVDQKEVKNKSVSDIFNNGEGKASKDSVLKIINHQGTLTANAASFDNLVRDLMDNVKTIGHSDDQTMLEDAINNFISKLANGGHKHEDDTADKNKGMITDFLYQGKRIFVYSTKTKVEGFDVTLTSKLGIKIIEAKKPAKEAPTLRKAECLELLNIAEELMKITIAFKNISKDVNTLVKSVAAVADTQLKLIDKGDIGGGDEYNKGKMGIARSLVTSVTSIASRWITLIPAWNVKVGNTVVTYVLASKDNWKKDTK